MKSITKNERAELSKLHYEIIMAPGYCEICMSTFVGNRFNLELAHIIPRGHHLFTYHPLNGVCLCHYHHQDCKVCAPHQSMEGFARWLMAFKPRHFEWYREHKNRVGYTGYEEAKRLLVEFKERMKDERMAKVVAAGRGPVGVVRGGLETQPEPARPSAGSLPAVSGPSGSDGLASLVQDSRDRRVAGMHEPVLEQGTGGGSRAGDGGHGKDEEVNSNKGVKS